MSSNFFPPSVHQPQPILNLPGQLQGLRYAFEPNQSAAALHPSNIAVKERLSAMVKDTTIGDGKRRFWTNILHYHDTWVDDGKINNLQSFPTFFKQIKGMRNDGVMSREFYTLILGGAIEGWIDVCEKLFGIRAQYIEMMRRSIDEWDDYYRNTLMAKRDADRVVLQTPQSGRKRKRKQFEQSIQNIGIPPFDLLHQLPSPAIKRRKPNQSTNASFQKSAFYSIPMAMIGNKKASRKGTPLSGLQFDSIDLDEAMKQSHLLYQQQLLTQYASATMNGNNTNTANNANSVYPLHIPSIPSMPSCNAPVPSVPSSNASLPSFNPSAPVNVSNFNAPVNAPVNANTLNPSTLARIQSRKSKPKVIVQRSKLTKKRKRKKENPMVQLQRTVNRMVSVHKNSAKVKDFISVPSELQSMDRRHRVVIGATLQMIGKEEENVNIKLKGKVIKDILDEQFGMNESKFYLLGSAHTYNILSSNKGEYAANETFTDWIKTHMYIPDICGLKTKTVKLLRERENENDDDDSSSLMIPDLLPTVPDLM